MSIISAGKTLKVHKLPRLRYLIAASALAVALGAVGIATTWPEQSAPAARQPAAQVPASWPFSNVPEIREIVFFIVASQADSAQLQASLAADGESVPGVETHVLFVETPQQAEVLQQSLRVTQQEQFSRGVAVQVVDMRRLGRE